MKRRDISTALLASATGAALLSKKAESQTCTAPCYPTIAAETTAGVTVRNTAYPPMYVDRYVVSYADTASAFSDAFKVARIAGGLIRYGATAPYTTTSPINFTTAGAPNAGGVTLRCEAGPGVDPPKMSIIGNHSGHVFDLTGTDSMVFENVSITSGTTTPKTAIFQSRNSSAGSVGNSFFINCAVSGSFSVAAYYNYGAELDEISGGYWRNAYIGGGAAVLLYTESNIKSQSSSFQTVASGSQSCIAHNIRGSGIYMQSSNAAADCIYLDGINNLKMFGPWMYCSDGTSPGRALIYVDMTNSASNLVQLFGVQGEVGNNAKYGVCFSANARTATGWKIFGGYMPMTTRAIFAGTGAVLDELHVHGLEELTGLGLQCGTLQNSVISGVATVLNVTTSIKNKLIGDSSRWTIGTRQNDNWDDIGSVNKVWTAGTSGITVSGTITTNDGKYQLIGNVAHVNLALISSGTLSATAGQAILGLPFPASATGGSLNIMDASSAQVIGSASVIAGQSSILLPAISARRGVYIGGTYFVA